MSLSPIGGPSRRQDDGDNNDSKTATTRAVVARDFDFDGSAYSHVQLPTGVLAHATASVPSAATIKADVEDLEKKVIAFHFALASPQMKEAVAKNGAALYTLVKMETKLAAIVAAVAVLKQFGVATVGALRFFKDSAAAVAAVVAIPEDFAKFTAQFKEATPTFGGALAPVMMAAADVAKSATKLVIDARLAGVR